MAGAIDAPIKSPPAAEDLGERSQQSPAATPQVCPAKDAVICLWNKQSVAEMERRLPLVLIVRLAQVEREGTDGEEKTYTDNISKHGACIFSTRPWKFGEKVR